MYTLRWYYIPIFAHMIAHVMKHALSRETDVFSMLTLTACFISFIHLEIF